MFYFVGVGEVLVELESRLAKHFVVILNAIVVIAPTDL